MEEGLRCRALAEDGAIAPEIVVPHAVALGFTDKWTRFQVALEDAAQPLAGSET